MIKRSVLLLLFWCSWITPEFAQSFQILDEKISYEHSRFLSLRTGLGFTEFHREKGIDGEMGFGLQVALGHHWNRYLQTEIVYQFSTFRFQSPDPVAPNLRLDTRAAMNQIYGRVLWSYPKVLLQPFLSLGFGGYNLFDVNRETALSFPFSIMIPASAGVRAYLAKSWLSLDAEFMYQYLFGVNQSSSTLALLGLSKVNFHTYGTMISFTFHMF